MTGPTILVTRDGLGHAEPALGRKLAGTFLDLLDLEGRLPARICFYTEGVRLACEGSPVLDTLAALADRGVELIVCTTCLQYYGLVDQLRVGTAGNMNQIQAALWEAPAVLSV
ncbi:MAG TPA: DsrE family protein [Candidatus Krumholzibacteria bacterium]|nr:DsrE family protein [Candidatus Krumholzibacteria bacterium]HPD72870.1 DsrE family protein [Candidatus Krumholzibacteria bacterium]HRY41669.1 DsrE family protein [Candidatus Krumholzibacteria bacterium]